jgi:predicted nucleotidyltransferase
MTQPCLAPRELDLIRSVLTRHPTVTGAILFGSRAKGTAHPASDVDLALEGIADILMAASMVRDDLPWLYELAMEVYRAVKAGNAEAIQSEMKRLRRFSDLMMSGPFMEEFGFGGKESRKAFSRTCRAEHAAPAVSLRAGRPRAAAVFWLRRNS